MLNPSLAASQQLGAYPQTPWLILGFRPNLMPIGSPLLPLATRGVARCNLAGWLVYFGGRLVNRGANSLRTRDEEQRDGRANRNPPARCVKERA